MKRIKRSMVGKPAHVRASEALLSVCDMGMDNPDAELRVAFAILSETIQRKRDAWDASQSPRHTDKPEAALAGAGK